jgi:hypothetical protein
MSRFLSRSLAAAFGLALVGGAAFAQDKQDQKPMDPDKTVNEQQEKGMEKGKDATRARDDASPAKAPAQPPSDITNKDRTKKRKMAKEGKDYDAANKDAAKANPPAAAAPKKDLRKQQQHQDEVNKGKDVSEHDATPVQK